VAEIINSAADPEANIIFGAVVDETLGDTLWVTVVAAGFDATTEEPAVEEALLARQEAANARPAVAAPSSEAAPPTPSAAIISREDAIEATRGLADAVPSRGKGDDDDLEVPSFLK
jgi:cell division protein FtsZ